MSKLLPNLPIEDLTSENDFLGIIDKGELIKAFLESNTSEFEKIKMFTIYGEWGSGKSTFLKYLEKELKKSFNTFFFEAWQFEKDENLPYTFLEFLLEKSNSVEEEFYNSILKYGGKILRGLGNSVKVKVPLYPDGPSINIEPSKFVEEFSKNESSFYKSLEGFKTEFVRWEDYITKGKKPNYNIVFIDDLDRCEPENVLNLLSVIKLFFTYGKKTIFFCGIDKKAVGEAVKTKYREIVKANEYLEKIFDISFSMPHYEFTYRLIDYYLKGLTIKYINDDKNLSDLIDKYFSELHFTNPRRVKKVLNKYLIIQNLIENQSLNKERLPNIITKNTGTLFETYLTLFLLILYEFEPENFKQLFDLNNNRANFSIAIERTANNSVISNNDIYGRINNVLNKNVLIKKIGELEQDFLIAVFAPEADAFIGDSILPKGGELFVRDFSYKRKSYRYYFINFLFNSKISPKNEKALGHSLMDYKNMIINIV